MIFKRELAEAILRREKTATRRCMNDNPRSPWCHKRCGYKIGQVFTINPGRGVKVDAAWEQINGECLAGEIVWVVEFELVEQGGTA